MVIECARHMAGLDGANSREFDPTSPYPVIDLMDDQNDVVDMGGTMRLGSYWAQLLPGSQVARAYGTEMVSERHRHRYEVNPRYRSRLEEAGLVCSGTSPDGRLVEFIELPGHPFWVGTQAHPEFKSRPDRAPSAVPRAGGGITGPSRRARPASDRHQLTGETADPPGADPVFRQIDESLIHKAWFVSMVRATFVDPHGTEFEREIVRHPGAVAVVPVTDDGAVLLVRQYRPAVDRWLYEIPAGTCDVAGEPYRDHRPAGAGRGDRPSAPGS